MTKKTFPGFADAIETTAPGVVGISVRKTPATGIVWDEHTIVTASYPLRSREVRVQLPDDLSIIAHRVGRDRSLDVAVLNVEEKLTPVEFADTDSLRLGDFVVALGRPGRAARAAFGMISGIGPEWHTHHGATVHRYISVDGTLPTGFAGGPLINAQGEVLGLNTPGLVRGGTTIPTETLRRVVEQARSRGDNGRPYLGLGLQPAKVSQAQAAVIDREDALVVISVDPEGPGESAGIGVGDLVCSVDDTPVDDLRSLLKALVTHNPGDEVALTLLRGKKTESVALALGSRPRRA